MSYLNSYQKGAIFNQRHKLFYTTIEHEDGLVTKYMHHSRMYVKIGQKVEKGQQIGLSGTTGYSTGNHLHFQVEKNGVAMNPAIYLMDGGIQARACD